MVVAEADPPGHSLCLPPDHSSLLVLIDLKSNKFPHLLRCLQWLMLLLTVTLLTVHTMVMLLPQLSSLMVKAITTVVLHRTRQHQHTTQAILLVLDMACEIQQWQLT